MTQPSGWYDDPQDPSQLRYWDGVVWSSHVSPKVSPTVGQSTIGMPYGVIPAAARPQSAGSQGAQGAPTAPGGFVAPPQDQQQGGGQRGGQWPAYGQPAAPQLGWQSNPATTPDGALLSGWWLRVGARVLDGILTFLLALPLTGWFYYQYGQGLMSWSNDLAAQAASGSSEIVAIPWGTYGYAFAASIIGLVVAGIYEVFFLTRRGATPGKKIVGISVRLRDQGGPPPMKTAVIRTICYLGMSLISVAGLLDVLWPLWDPKRQAIHDKAAATNVVIGPQPKRDA